MQKLQACPAQMQQSEHDSDSAPNLTEVPATAHGDKTPQVCFSGILRFFVNGPSGGQPPPLDAPGLQRPGGTSERLQADLPVFPLLLPWRSVDILGGSWSYDTGLFDPKLIHLTRGSHSREYRRGKQSIVLH